MSEPAWMIYARAEIGDQEIRDNNKIVGWAKSIGGFIGKYFTNAHTVPWCGLFVDAMLRKAGVRTLGDNALGARNWAAWGQRMTGGAVGAVLVFERPGGGHVGFYVGEDATTYSVLGGNQSDSVCIERILKSRCIAIRWPDELTATVAPVMLSQTGTPLSTNEA